MDTQVKFNNSPEVIGPGIWWSYTRKAIKATSIEAIQQFKKDLRDMIYNFPCLECRPHAIEYYERNPIENLEHLTLGMYSYMWDFHNAVNRRLGKPEISFAVGLAIHRGEYDGVCTEGCGDTSDNEDAPKIDGEGSYRSNLNTQNVKITFTPR